MILMIIGHEFIRLYFSFSDCLKSIPPTLSSYNSASCLRYEHLMIIFLKFLSHLILHSMCLPHAPQAKAKVSEIYWNHWRWMMSTFRLHEQIFSLLAFFLLFYCYKRVYIMFDLKLDLWLSQEIYAGDAIYLVNVFTR